MLEHIDLPKQDLYDGVDTGLYEQTFALPVDDISFSPADRELKRFAELQAQVGDAAFEQVIAEAGIRRRYGTFKGVDDLNLEFLVRGGYLFVLAIGERSAGRYQLALQGVWRIV